jgi:hypothetical protein
MKRRFQVVARGNERIEAQNEIQIVCRDAVKEKSTEISVGGAERQEVLSAFDRFLEPAQ